LSLDFLYCGSIASYFTFNEIHLAKKLTLIKKYEIVLMAVCMVKCLVMLGSILCALFGQGGRERWLVTFYGFNLAEATIQLLTMLTVAVTLDLTLTESTSAFASGEEQATSTLSFYRAGYWMNTHLVALYSSYWFVEAVGGLKLKICNEYASGIGKAFLLFALGMAAGAVNLHHAREYWVNYDAVVRKCPGEPWTPKYYWDFYANVFGDMHMIRVALVVLTV
jgi:hypothetical protein